MAFLKFVVVRIAFSAAIYLAVGVGLILSQSPSPPAERASLDFYELIDGDGDRRSVPERSSYQARDGKALSVRRFEARGVDQGAILAIVVHGSGWHGGGYLQLARTLADAGLDVLVPDLRGHGVAPQLRGDVDYIGQFEDDLADLILAERREGQPVALVGHSSGGGLVIRFAGGVHGAMLDRAVLIAPFLKYDAPTMRENAGGWASPLTRRIIGLSMLNRFGITALNGLTVMQFNFPAFVLDGPQGKTATPSYSFRLNSSFAPRDDYLADVRALPPFLLVVGAKDGAFHAELFEPTLKAATDKGTYLILPDVGHLGALVDPRALEAIATFLRAPSSGRPVAD